MTTMQTYDARPNGLETCILPGSPVVGMTVRDLEKKYAIKCDHIHNSPPEPHTKKFQLESLRLEEWMGIHVWGRPEDISRLLQDLNPAC